MVYDKCDLSELYVACMKIIQTSIYFVFETWLVYQILFE